MKTLLISLRVFLLMTLLTGVAYPLLITGTVRLFFPGRADGSLVTREGTIEGSRLIGQTFTTDRYFSSRPSAISCNPMPSGGSNLGLTNSLLKVLYLQRRHDFIVLNQLDSTTVIPPEMLFASASGLDPDISPRAALLQVERVVKARHFNRIQKEKLLACIHELTRPPQLIFLGSSRINVFLLNLETDKIR
jgi:K+-transporting ATPase ATPase C chain